MFPGVSPGAITEYIANGIAGNGIAIISCQQIAPVGVTIAVADRIQNTAKGSGGVSVFLLAEDIARIIVSPYPGQARRLVVLTGQLVLVVIGIGRGVGTVIDSFNITALSNFVQSQIRGETGEVFPR